MYISNLSRRIQFDEEAELGAIYILPIIQSQGIGSQLLIAAIKELSGIKNLYVVVEIETLSVIGFIILKDL